MSSINTHRFRKSFQVEFFVTKINHHTNPPDSYSQKITKDMLRIKPYIYRYSLRF